jgi:orotidine-5'-phosphate decarboxylase
MKLNGNRIILALDVPDVAKAHELVMNLSPYVGNFKIGLEFITAMLANLITADGDAAAHFALKKMRDLFQRLDGNIFWDGKFKDIPNTIAGATKALEKLHVKMFNVHASAGAEAMKAAAANKGDALALAVTVLTSIDDKASGLIYGAPARAKVLQFAHFAQDNGFDGIVCSPQELYPLGETGAFNDFIKVTPGIRSADAPPDDQKRTMTPTEAVVAGADFLVIGRPITGAADPVAAAKKIAEEIAVARRQREAA